MVWPVLPGNQAPMGLHLYSFVFIGDYGITVSRRLSIVKSHDYCSSKSVCAGIGPFGRIAAPNGKNL